MWRGATVCVFISVPAAPVLRLNWHRLGGRLRRGKETFRREKRGTKCYECGPYNYKNVYINTAVVNIHRSALHPLLLLAALQRDLLKCDRIYALKLLMTTKPDSLQHKLDLLQLCLCKYYWFFSSVNECLIISTCQKIIWLLLDESTSVSLVYDNHAHNKGRLSSPRSLFQCNNKACVRCSHPVCFRQSALLSLSLDHDDRVFRERIIFDCIKKYSMYVVFLSVCLFMYIFLVSSFYVLCISCQSVIKLCLGVSHLFSSQILCIC